MPSRPRTLRRLPSRLERRRRWWPFTEDATVTLLTWALIAAAIACLLAYAAATAGG